MKFKQIRNKERFSTTVRYRGTKNGFKFEVASGNNQKYYVLVNHKTLDIRYNSLWGGIDFPDLQAAYDWCELFDSANFECVGNDVNKNHDMTYKQQYTWLVENGFVEYESTVIWSKSYETFRLEMWRAKDYWELSVLDWTGLEDIPFFSLPDDFDFNKLTPLIKCYDELSTISTSSRKTTSSF